MSFRRFVCALGVLGFSAAAFAQLPTARLNSVFPPGGKQGATVEVTVAGADLDNAHKLHFSHSGITGAVKTREPAAFEQGKQPIANQFEVKIAADVPPGIYEARAVGKFGISNPRAFVVGDRAEVIEKEANNALEQAQEVPVESVVNGRSNGGADMDYFKFKAKKGQRVVVDCRGERIDSRMDPTLVLLDAAGNQLDSDRDTNRRDPLLDFTAPADGEYFVKLYDFVYGGGNDYFYRLSISTGPYIDYVLPNSAKPGATGDFTLFGRNLPGGQPAGVSIEGKPLQKLAVKITAPNADQACRLSSGMLMQPEAATLDGFEYRLSGSTGGSNPVLIGFAAADVVVEKEPNDKAEAAQKVSVPCEFSGQFQKPRDKDWITFDAKQGQVFWLEMVSQRGGVPADPYLLIQRVQTDDKGEVKVSDITAVDDSQKNIGGLQFNTASDDPAYRFAVPADGTYRVLVRDLYNRGRPRYVYRLCIRPEQPDFRLAAVPIFPTNNRNQTNSWSTLLRKGGAAHVDLYVFRKDGFNGNIEVSADGLPPGVSADPVFIGPGQNIVPFVFTAAEDAKDWAGVIQLIGKAKVGDKEIVRPVRGGAVQWAGAQNQPAKARITRDIALAVAGQETADFVVKLGDGKPLEMCRAGKLDIPVKVTRRNNFAGNVALAAQGMVNNLKVNNISVNGKNTDGKVTLTIPNNAPVGTYTFNFRATTQVNYRRNKDLADAAAAEKKRIDDLVKKITEESKQAADAAKKAPKEKKAEADKKAKEAADRLKAAQNAQKAAAKRASDLAKAANPKKTNVYKPSTTFTVKITPAPITFAGGPSPAKVKQGAKVEVPVTINRLYNYAEAVQLELAAPGGAKNLKLAKASVAKGQTAGKLVIEAAANATPGNHTLTLRATARFNNQNLQITQELPLTVEAVTKK